MARSRLYKVGTIHSRTTGLLRAGAMREEDKPLWFDIYEAFPPKDEPRFDRPASSKPIRDILYEEDIIRAKYHRDHRNLPPIRLDKQSYMTQTKKFIAAYQQLKKDGTAESELYPKAVSQAVSQSIEFKIDESKQRDDQLPSATAASENKKQNINIDITELFKNE